MVKKNERQAILEGVEITFRNFRGLAKKFNNAGKRNFVVLLEDSVAERMAADGWTLKTLKPKPDDAEPLPERPILPVQINFGGKPPKIVMITSKGRTHLDESTVDMLDFVDIETVDLIVNPYDWSMNGDSGTAAYLEALYITIRENYFERKYADLDFASGPGRVD